MTTVPLPLLTLEAFLGNAVGSHLAARMPVGTAGGRYDIGYGANE